MARPPPPAHAMTTRDTSPAAPAGPAPGPGQTFRGPFALMTVLFFMWGFMTVWNDILIPRFKEAFTLNYRQAMLVQGAFFGAYGVGALAYYVVSMRWGDPINRIGYKKGVITGLLIAAGGSALFYPAAVLVSYPCFLLGLFVVGLGFAMLQIAANPYVTILGPERTASSRLNLSQAFNSFGTTIGPIIAGWLIFSVFARPHSHGADAVKIPYLCFALVFALLAVLFRFAHLPDFAGAGPPGRGWGALKRPHTTLGMLAIFMYVGGEVAVGRALVNTLGTPRLGGISREAASGYLAFYWGGLMIGRFMGAFALSDLRPWLKRALIVLVPAAAFGVIVVAWGAAHAPAAAAGPGARISAIVGAGLPVALRYGVFLLVLPVLFFLGAGSPHRMLALFSAVNIALLAAGMLTAGAAAQWTILAVGMFCSVMWSNIFSLAIEGLGPLKSQASSLLVIAIIGGAVLPWLQGAVADRSDIRVSFVVPMAAFAFIAFYGLYGYRAGREHVA